MAYNGNKMLYCYRLLILLILSLNCLHLFAQTIYPFKTTISPKQLPEFSGLAKISSNLFVGINDSGNKPELVFMDSTSKFISSKILNNVTNIDWEDICVYHNHIYIGDFGDNFSKRQFLTIYEYSIGNSKITNKFDFNLCEKKINPKSQNHTFFDIEAFYIVNDSVHLFTKSHSQPYFGKCFYYKFHLQNPNTCLTAIDSFNFGNDGFLKNSITSAAISPNKKNVALISCSQLYLFVNVNGYNPFNRYFMRFNFEGLTQKEALCFSDNSTIKVADERTVGVIGGNVYVYHYTDYLHGIKKYLLSGIQCDFKVNKKKNIASFTFKSDKNRNTLKLLLFNVNHKLINEFKIDAGIKKIEQTIDLKAVEDYSYFWLVDGNEILCVTKIN